MTPIASLFDRSRAQFSDFLRRIDHYAPNLARIGANNPPEPRWDQLWFPRLDACAAYAMVREHEPQQIVEIGAGHSTRFLTRAMRDGKLATRLTTIDPSPRARIHGLDIDWIAACVQDAVLPELQPGDILFVDSSHIAAPGSDVDFLIGRVLPSLPCGVLIHFHDVFLPDPYPAEWDYRGYNEQDAVAALIVGGGCDLLFSSRYVATRMKDELAARRIAHLPLKDEAFENSLWLRKL